MLTEISSDKFRQGSVIFHNGLNVILGDENATNSIGKSTLLMVIDFAFGGNSLLEHNRDVVQELGDHDYEMKFTFGLKSYRFRRGTNEPDVVYRFDEFTIVEGEKESTTLELSPISVEEYRAFLKSSYGLADEDLSFRSLVGLYFRVWGKENMNVGKPLHVVHSQAARDCVNTLIKTYRRYASIEALTSELWSEERQQNALRSAFKNNIVPKIGKKAHKHNVERIEQIEKDIEDIKINLARYATNIAEIVNQEVLEQKIQKDQLLDSRLRLQSKLARVERNLSTSKFIKSKHFAGLVEFFPDINKERLVEVEEFHSKLAVILKSELRETGKALTEQLASINEGIAEIDERMSLTLSSIDQPSLVVDRVYELSTSLNRAVEENSQYEAFQDIKLKISKLKDDLSVEKEKVLSHIQKVVNDGLRRIVTAVFGADRKSPELLLSDSSYSFKVFEDTGTGTAYSALIVFDLTIFSSTILPFLAHDSVLFKNIENSSVAKLFKFYMSIERQSFVAIDEIQKYGQETAGILDSRSVIKLSDSSVLYVKDWRKK